MASERMLGIDLPTGLEKLSDDHHYHDQIDQLDQRAINNEGFYLHRKNSLPSGSDD